MNDLIQIIKILEPSELKDLNHFIDTLKFVRNQVFGTKGGLKVELDEERNKWSTLHVCQNENINKMSWETVECSKTPNK